MRILICGGHLTPALGVIQALPNDAEVLYVGRKYALDGDTALSLEYQTMQQLGIPFAQVITGRIHRKINRQTIPGLIKTPRGFVQAYNIIKKFKPDIILAFGSYVAIPLCIVGYIQRIPVVIHEQTLHAGLTNKFLAKFATKICVSFPSSLKYFPKRKTILTGNPALNEIEQHIQETKDVNRFPHPSLIILGGSQGSHIINLLIESIIEKLLPYFYVTHQTGDAKEFEDYDRLLQKRKSLHSELQIKYTLVKFIPPNDIIPLLKNTDIVISRAGINTVMTLTFLNKPALLIPLPHGQTNEQLTNALYFEKNGLGKVIVQTHATSEELLVQARELYKDREKYFYQGDHSELKIHTLAADKIIEILTLCKKQ